MGYSQEKKNSTENMKTRKKDKEHCLLILNRKSEVCEMQEAVSLDALKTTSQVKGEHKGFAHSPSDRYDSMRLGFLACVPEHTTCF